MKIGAIRTLAAPLLGSLVIVLVLAVVQGERPGVLRILLGVTVVASLAYIFGRVFGADED